MIKRFSYLFCAVLMVVMMLAVPAFAAEVQADSSIEIIQQPIDVHSSYDTEFTISVVVSGDVSSYQWQRSLDGGSTWADSTAWYAKTSNLTTKYYSFEGVDSACYRCVITGKDGSVVISDVAYVFFDPISLPSFISRCIHFVTSWVGSIVSSLVSSEGSLYPLLPILAIGIAVTAALLVVKIFKSFSWGL